MSIQIVRVRSGPYYAAHFGRTVRVRSDIPIWLGIPPNSSLSLLVDGLSYVGEWN